MSMSADRIGIDFKPLNLIGETGHRGTADMEESRQMIIEQTEAEEAGA